MLTSRTMILAASALTLHAQLNVIVGNATTITLDGYAAKILRIGDDGNVSNAGTLISSSGTSGTVGLYWLSVSQDGRKAVLLTHGRKPSFIVVDLDKAAVVKTCDVPTLPMPAVYQNLAELPDGRMVLMEQMFDSGQEKLAGLLLDPDVPCDKSLTGMVATDILALRVLGRSGVDEVGNIDKADVSIDQSGKLSFPLLGVSFPSAIPENLLAGYHNPISAILFSNPRLFVVGVFQKAMPHKILVYRERDQSWHNLPIPADRVFVEDGESTPAPWITGFGDFLALTEARMKSAEYPESPGAKAWRTNDHDTGPATAGQLQGGRIVFPGRLHLYDMEHERSYTITTNQADSEILLVEGGIVYYRVSDAIYKASIGETSLGPPQLVAQSEILGDAHWAFISRK